MKINKTITVLLIAIGLLLVGMFMTGKRESFVNPPGVKTCSKDADCDFNARCDQGICIARQPVTLVVPP